MRSYTTERFRKCFKRLPANIQRQARAAYRMFREDPWHPRLRFKQVHATKPIYSVRISIEYRAIGIRNKDEVVWFWIGSHADYERILAKQ